MKLSVIIPNYNHGRFIGEQLESIFNQTHKCHEVIVIDDKSTDDSVDVIRDLIKDNRTAYLVENKENIGPLNIFNIGIGLATGDYVAFLSADDRICSNLFEEASNLFSMNSDAGMFSGLGYQMDKDGKFENLVSSPLISTEPVYLTPDIARRYLASYSSWIVGQTMIFRKSCFEDFDIRFDPDLRHYSDIFVPIAITAKYGACFSPKTLASWRYYSGYAEQNFSDRKRDASLFDDFKDLCRSGKYKDLIPEKLLTQMECSKRVMYLNRRFFSDQSRRSLMRKIIEPIVKLSFYIYGYRFNFPMIFRILWSKRRYKSHYTILDTRLIR